MQYFGGKSRIAGQIATVINALKPEVYVEPFCGGCSVATKVEAPIRILSDLHPDLIAMWQALQDGWEPPDMLTEEEYYFWKAMDSPEPMRAFAGFGCSFAGKFFGGYARGEGGRNYASNAKNSVLARAAKLRDVVFHLSDYADALSADSCVAYLDPPYTDTTGYAVGTFDTITFWNFVRRRSSGNGLILVSEYTAPDDFTSVLDVRTKTDIRVGDGSKEQRVERLFIHADRLAEFMERMEY